MDIFGPSRGKMVKNGRKYGYRYRCCVPNCKSNTSKNPELSFHILPYKDRILLRKWLINIRRKNLPLKNSTKICSKHFQSHEVYQSAAGKHYLRTGVFPTIFDRSEDEREKKNKTIKSSPCLIRNERLRPTMCNWNKKRHSKSKEERFPHLCEETTSSHPFTSEIDERNDCEEGKSLFSLFSHCTVIVGTHSRGHPSEIVRDKSMVIELGEIIRPYSRGMDSSEVAGHIPSTTDHCMNSKMLSNGVNSPEITRQCSINEGHCRKDEAYSGGVRVPAVIEDISPIWELGGSGETGFERIDPQKVDRESIQMNGWGELCGGCDCKTNPPDVTRDNPLVAGQVGIIGRCRYTIYPPGVAGDNEGHVGCKRNLCLPHSSEKHRSDEQNSVYNDHTYTKTKEKLYIKKIFIHLKDSTKLSRYSKENEIV